MTVLVGTRAAGSVTWHRPRSFGRTDLRIEAPDDPRTWLEELVDGGFDNPSVDGKPLEDGCHAWFEVTLPSRNTTTLGPPEVDAYPQVQMIFELSSAHDAW